MRKPAIAVMRAIVYVAAVSPLVALVISLLSSSPVLNFHILARKWDVISDLGSSCRSKGHLNFYLVDRQSGEANPLALPEELRWGMVSVSPWCDQEGNAEGVGLCFTQERGGDGWGFWGLARLQMPQAKIIERFRLELLPTGRPCWIPGHPGVFLIAAADGQLHRFDLSSQTASQNDSSNEALDGSPLAVSSTVGWNAPRPCRGGLLLTDPVWPGHPAFPEIVFATLSPAPHPYEHGNQLSHQLWWLRMNEAASAIEASGPLIEPGSTDAEDLRSVKRFPDLAMGPDGSLLLVYLSSSEASGQRLEALPIEADPSSGHPRVVAGARPRVIASDCAMAPPVVSADRKAVYSVSKTTGRVEKHPIGAASVLAVR